MGFKLIIFDWDGTLMDSEARIVASIRAAFADMGKQPPSREAARDVIGLSLTDAMARLWPGADDTQRSRVAERYRLYNHGADETPLILFLGRGHRQEPSRP